MSTPPLVPYPLSPHHPLLHAFLFKIYPMLARNSSVCVVFPLFSSHPNLPSLYPTPFLFLFSFQKLSNVGAKQYVFLSLSNSPKSPLLPSPTPTSFSIPLGDSESYPAVKARYINKIIDAISLSQTPFSPSPSPILFFIPLGDIVFPAVKAKCINRI